MPTENRRPTNSSPSIAPPFPASSVFTGSGYFVGDDVSSDDIIGPDYLSFDLSQRDERRVLATYAFAELADRYGQFSRVESGDAALSPYQFILAGERLGHGSGRHHPVVALQEAGVRIILAKSYGAAFYRACVNVGSIIPLILSPNDLDWISAQAGMAVEIDVTARSVRIKDLGVTTTFEDPGVVLEIAAAGGLGGFLSGSKEA